MLGRVIPLHGMEMRTNIKDRQREEKDDTDILQPQPPVPEPQAKVKRIFPEQDNNGQNRKNSKIDKRAGPGVPKFVVIMKEDKQG